MDNMDRATIRPALSFDPSADASILHKAMKGFGTDKKAIIAVLGRRTSQQRQQIIPKYQRTFGKDLVKDLKHELHGTFKQAILSLMTPLPDYLAQELNNAMKGVGTKERTLIEILCSSNNQTIGAINAAYQSKFGHPLENDLRSDLGGDFRHFMTAIAKGKRDERNNDDSKAAELAKALYEAGEKKRLGTDEAEFIRILISYSFPVLRSVFNEYVKIAGKSLEVSITSETSGDFKDGLLAMYSIINNCAAFFANELEAAMKGAGTKDDTLIRIIITRSEIDMGSIKDEYSKIFMKDLDASITKETSGDYKRLLLTMIQE